MFLKKALAFILSASMALSAAVLPITASADEASETKTGKVTTTIDRKVKTVTFTKGDTVKTIDATKYYSELQYINNVDVKTKEVEVTFDEADFGEYTITTEAYVPSTFELTSKIGGEAVSTVTVGDGSDIALTVSGDVNTTAPTTDYTKVKNNTIIWDMKKDKAWSPATIQYIDAVQGKDNIYIAGALSDNSSAETDVYLIADTTSGKIQSWGRGDWMQVNNNTKLKVPVMKDTKVTVNSYNAMSGKIDGKDFNTSGQTDPRTLVYYYVGADNGLSTIDFTSSGGYLGYIKTEPVTRKTVDLTVTGETTGTLSFTDDASGDVVYAGVTDANVALLPGQTYSIAYGTMEADTFTPSDDKHVTSETNSITAGDSTTSAAVTIESGAAAKTGKVTLTTDGHAKKVTLVDQTDNTKKIELVSGVNTIEEADFGKYDVVAVAKAPATYTLTTNPATVTIAENSNSAIDVKGAVRTTNLPETDYDVVKANTIEWTVVDKTTTRPASYLDVALEGNGDVAVAGAIQGQSDDAEVYMLVKTTPGKFNTRQANEWTQINEGTVLKIPVAKDTKISLTAMGDLNMSVGDETVTGKPAVYYYTGDDNSYVNLTQNNGSSPWLKSITTEPMTRKTVAVTVTGGADGDCLKFTNAVTGDVQYGTIASGAVNIGLLQGFTYAVDYGTMEGETFTASETKALENDSKTLAVSSSTTAASLTVKTLDPSKKHTITIDSSITNGTITTTPSAKADEDTEVTITATRAENYKLKSGSVKVTKTGDSSTEVEVTDGKFTMPDYDVTVTAEFEASTETEGQLYVNAAYTALETDATHFKTISEAVAAAKLKNPQNEESRITINVYPGDYEEQVRIDGMKYLTLQQTPGTSDDGRVNLSWYFCTNYYTSNTDLNGQYDPKIDWSKEETWNGYKDDDEKFTKYTIGQDLSNVSTISYYDTDGVAHKNVTKNSMLDRLGGLAWSYDKMAPLIVTQSSSDITIKDLNLINSTVVMKTQGQDDGHLTPNPSGKLPDHKALSICDETTTLVKPTADIYSTKDGSVDLDKYKAYVAKQGDDFKFTPGESAWLLQSSAFNERGHAIAILGDRIICENIRVRGNQDSVWVSDGRTYFKNCDLIGGTDYIYGSASAVFDNCKLGFAGFTDKSYGSPLATPNTPASRKYGYLFFNCTIYNVRDNNGANNFGGPWGVDGQSTFYNTVLDDKAEIGKSALKIEDKGWGRFGAENGLSRLYEFGTKNNSGAAVDLSKRVVNLSKADGGPGMGTVLDKWHILEFNPRNVFSTKNDSSWSADWDPMNFAPQLADTDAALNNTTVSVPAGNGTEITLPTPTDNSIEFHWESNSTNAIVSRDGTKLTVVRPALGEDAINSSVILYARNTTTGYGDKKEIPVTIAATTDTTNVFNIPVTITASVAPETAVDYTVTIKKDGALIKSQTITMPANSRTVTATIENVPASTSGIDYDLKIVPETDEYSIKTPENGAKTVTGITGEDVTLNVEATKLVDKKVSLSTINYSNASGSQSYDLIALAKAADAEADGDIDISDVITVEYDFVPASANAAGYMDLRSNTTTSKNTNADNKRFVLERVNASWNQLDTADCTQGFSGVQNVDGHQWLNIAGKYAEGADITTTAHITTTINYKTQTITQSATGSGTRKDAKADPFTFTGFPDADKGSMYLYLYSDGGTWGVQNVSVTYKQLVVQKYTVTITGGEGIEDVKLGTLTGTKSGNTYTFTDVPEGAYTFDVTYTAGYEKADASPASITVSDDKTTETISAKPTEVTPPAPEHTYLELLSAFASKIKIEKTTGQNGAVELTATAEDGETVPAMKAYIAVYEGQTLKELKSIAEFTSNKATLTAPAVTGTESYKIFIWTDSYEPVTAPITASTTGNNKLFN